LGVREAVNGRPVIVIGASAGGVSALLTLCAALPPGFKAPVLIVLHIGANTSVLPSLLASHGNNPAVHAEHGQRLENGTLYVAPPDHHMLLEGDTIRLSRGPKEHHTRPAIDPLFRSAALAMGSGVIGVVLTGRLDDGASGLQAIKECGGLAIVQDPADAEFPGMPESALESVDIDYCVPLADLGKTLVHVVDRPIAVEPAALPVRERLEREMEVFRGEGNPMERLNQIGKPSMFACPDCDGVLWQIDDSKLPRYRCHTGHAFSLRTLEETQSSKTEDALWGAIRALEQRESLLRALARQSRSSGAEEDAKRSEAEADETALQAARLQQKVETL
jgi:two-component system chemotaxis response regulator CheB